MFPRCITAHLTDEDYITFSLFSSNRNHGDKKRFFVLGIILMVAGMLLITNWLLNHGTQFPHWGIFCFTYGTVLVLFRKQLRRSGLKSQIKALKKKGSLPYSPESTYEFNEDCLRCITHDEISDMGYTALEQICVVPDKVVYLYKSTLSAYILPMSAFASAEECRALLHYLQSKKPGLQITFCAE